MSGGLVVETPGFLDTIQDSGRFGYQRYGISPAGAMDADLLAIANRLVGNPVGEAAIEITFAGPTMLVRADACRVAVAGDFPVAVNGVEAAAWTALDLVRGDRLRIGAARAGLRGYLAVAGGLALAPTLGSLSTHTRTGIGGIAGGPLKAGDDLPLGDAGPKGPPCVLDRPPPIRSGQPVRVVLGPQADAFTAAGIDTFLGADWVMSPRSDRMGCRLEGPAVEHRAGFNIVSDGIVNGSIQVPGGGRPIVLLADRQTTGGYPKIATVMSADLRLLAQRRPGETVRFAAVGEQEAVAASRAARADLEAVLRRIAPAVRPGRLPAADDLMAMNLVGGAVSATADPFAGETGPVGAGEREEPR